MLKIIKEKLPTGCTFVEKTDPEPTICPIDNSKLRIAIEFLEGSDGVNDESYVIVDKKITNPVFLNVIKNIINGVNGKFQTLRFDGDAVSLNEDEGRMLICLDLDDDYSIIGEKIASKLSNMSESEIANFANFPEKHDGSPILVKQVGGYKPTGESSFFDKLDKRNESLKKWNAQNKRFLNENNIPYAPEEKHGVLETLKEIHSATSSISGVVGDVGAAIDSVDKLKNWWEKYKINKSYEDEEKLSRQKVFERNRLSSMFLRSKLKKVEDNGFESMSVLTNIFNMGFTNILKAPHYFDQNYLKVLFQICSICVSNALPPNKIINIRMNISQLSSLKDKLENKYGKVI